MSAPPSGEQFEIGSGEQRAVIVEVGRRRARVRGGGARGARPYPLGAMCDGAHGAPLIPWPNRLADGALLLRRRRASARAQRTGQAQRQPWTAALARLAGAGAPLRPRGHGRSPAPHAGLSLRARCQHRLRPRRRRAERPTTAVNVGELACPFGAGQHPYISAGEGLLDDCLLELPARTRLLADEERQLPTGREALAGQRLRLPQCAAARRALQIDSGFTDLERDADGLVRCKLTRADGSTVELWADSATASSSSTAPTRSRRSAGAAASQWSP